MDRLPAISTSRRPPASTSAGPPTNRRLQRLIDENKAPDLLELHNSFISNAHSFSKDQEMTDLSHQLKSLRRDLNKRTCDSSTNEKQLHSLQFEKNILEKMNLVSGQKLSTIDQKQKLIQEKLQETLKMQQVEEKNKEIYMHLLDRMRISQVHLTVKINHKKQEVKQGTLVLDEALKKEERAKKEVEKCKQAWKQLAESARLEVGLRKKDVHKLETEIMSTQKAKFHKEEVRRLQQEKLEQDLINASSQKAEAIKAKLALHRLWYFLINIRFDKEHQRWQRIENAFQSIKVKTGVSDIHEVVERFLTKEKSLEGLMETVRQKEAALDQFKTKIDQIQASVNGLASKSIDTKDFSELNQQLLENTKVTREVHAKYTEINNTYQKVDVWINRMAKRVLSHFAQSPTQKLTVLEAIQLMHKMVQTHMQKVASAKEQVATTMHTIKAQPLTQLMLNMPHKLRKTESQDGSEIAGLEGIDQEIPYV